MTAHQIPETDGAEGDEAEVERVQVRPALHRRIHGRRAAGYHHGGQAEDQHHVIDGGFPAGQGARGKVLADPRREEAAGTQAAQTHGLHHHGQQGNDALQKEVEEEDGGCATQQTVEDQEDPSSDCHWRAHPKTYKDNKKHFKTKVQRLRMPITLLEEVTFTDPSLHI